MYLNIRRNGDTLEVELAGTLARRRSARHRCRARRRMSFADAGTLRIIVPESVATGSGRCLAAARMDEGGGKGRPRRRVRGRMQPGQLELIDSTLEGKRTTPRSSSESEFQPVSRLGRLVLRRWQSVLVALDFLGHTTITWLRACTSWRRLRPISIARHLYETGLTAIPIVSLIAFLITVIIAYIAAQYMREYGAEIYVVDLITISVLRELAVLLTAIIVAGRSGSAFAAEIGAMKLNEEVDALHAIGVDPHEVLVLPRVIGLVIALPLLTVVADLVGMTGGALLCHWLLDMPLVLFMERAQDSIASTTFWVGIIKAPVFALLIALTGTYRGLQVRDSSRELGRLTTTAVVQSIFLVLLADALFAVAFWLLDI